MRRRVAPCWLVVGSQASQAQQPRGPSGLGEAEQGWAQQGEAGTVGTAGAAGAMSTEEVDARGGAAPLSSPMTGSHRRNELGCRA